MVLFKNTRIYPITQGICKMISKIIASKVLTKKEARKYALDQISLLPMEAKRELILTSRIRELIIELATGYVATHSILDN